MHVNRSRLSKTPAAAHGLVIGFERVITPTKAMRAQCCVESETGDARFCNQPRESVPLQSRAAGALSYRGHPIRALRRPGIAAQGVAFRVQIAPDDPRLGISVDDACAGFDALCNRLTACRATFHQRLRLVHEQRAWHHEVRRDDVFWAFSGGST